MSDLDLDRLEALRAAAADHKCEEETGYMHPCPRAEFSLAVHETFPALLRAAREKEVLFLEREAMLADHKEMRAADVAVLTRRAEEAENLRDQFESRVRAAEQGEETATRRAEAAEARAEKWKKVADSWARDAARWKAIYPHMGFVAWPLHEHTLATEPPPSSTEKE